MSNFIVTAYAASNVGNKRQNNEDNFYINKESVNSKNDVHSALFKGNAFVGAVCDGMGGEEAGEVASQLAVETIQQYENKIIASNFSDEVINELIFEANDKICNEINRIKKRMGTTFAFVGINSCDVVVSNVGDSRVYRLSNSKLEQISHDHTEAQSMVDAGMISKEESMKIKQKHRLTQHLGIFPYEMIIEPYIVRIPAKIGDRFLLCSDGLTDMVSENEIESILNSRDSLKNTVDRLISKALENGGKDNVTVMLCEIELNSEAPFVCEETAIPKQAQPTEKLALQKYDFSTKRNATNQSMLIKILLVVVILLSIAIAVIGINIKSSNKNNKASTKDSVTTSTSVLNKTLVKET